MAFKSHEDYFKSIPPKSRKLLRTIQAEVEALLPDVSRCISYNMPAFKHERVFFYFAAFKKHIGIYPPVRTNAILIRELAPYRGPKGNLSFSLDEPMPVDLIGRVAQELFGAYAKR